MPLGIKDIIETADMPTEQGSPLFVGCRTGRDAASVAALREAGAVILGKVVTTEFAATEPLCELPSVLNWSIAGLRRLRNRGYFLQPPSAAEIVQDLEDLGSPITAFLREECSVGPSHTVEVNLLFEAWTEFSKRQGRDNAGTTQTFGRDLRAKLPGLTTIRPRDDQGGRLRFYQGIGLR
jgi:hypothetical protein